MPNKMQMRGAWVGHCVLQNSEASCFVRLNMRCDLTKAVRDEMGWDEPGLKTKLMDLEGELPAGRLLVQCQQQTTSGSSPELRIDYDRVSSFRAVRVKEKNQESTRVELRFHIQTTSGDAAALIFSYKQQAKKSLGDLKMEWPEPGGAVGKVEETPLFKIAAGSSAPIDSTEGERISLVQGMAAGKRGERKGKGSARAQLAEAVAAEAPSVGNVDLDSTEAARAAEAISHSLTH